MFHADILSKLGNSYLIYYYAIIVVLFSVPQNVLVAKDKNTAKTMAGRGFNLEISSAYKSANITVVLSRFVTCIFLIH